MSARARHRGPDDEGVFDDGPVALAARRLSIIDLDHGHQPIANEDGSVVVVQNGEIYNYRELQRRAARAAATASPPTATPRSWSTLYEERGDGFVERLRGMFAIALWDERRRRLLLARDRFGIKPLYYRPRDGGLSFASELKAMLEQPGFSREIDPKARRRLPRLQLDPGAADDLRRGAQAAPRAPARLGGGRGRDAPLRAAGARSPAAELRRGSVERARRGAARGAPRLRPRPPRRRRPGRGPALRRGRLRRPHRARRAPSPASRCRPSRSASRRAASTSSRAPAWSPSATAPTTTSWSSGPTRSSCCRGWSRPSTSPSATPRRCPTYLVSELAAGEVKVALSGEGGDELFGGYYTYVADLLAPPRRPPRAARPAAGRGAAELRRPGRLRLQSQALRPRRRAAAAGAPPRLEGDLLAADARAALLGGRRRRLGPARPLPRALRRDRRRRAAGPDAGRRPRHLPGRRPAGQDRPAQHGPLAGAAGPLPRPARSPSSPSRCRRR